MWVSGGTKYRERDVCVPVKVRVSSRAQVQVQPGVGGHWKLREVDPRPFFMKPIMRITGKSLGGARDPTGHHGTQEYA